MVEVRYQVRVMRCGSGGGSGGGSGSGSGSDRGSGRAQQLTPILHKLNTHKPWLVHVVQHNSFAIAVTAWGVIFGDRGLGLKGETGRAGGGTCSPKGALELAVVRLAFPVMSARGRDALASDCEEEIFAHAESRVTPTSIVATVSGRSTHRLKMLFDQSY